LIGGQIAIVLIGGRAFSVKRLSGPQWAVSIVLGLLSIPLGMILRVIPVEALLTIIPFPRPRTLSSHVYSPKTQTVSSGTEASKKSAMSSLS